MIPASIIYADLLAYAVRCGDFWPCGTPRSRDFPWEPEAPMLTPAEIEHEAYKLDQRSRYAERTGTGKRSYALRFDTPEVLEHHRKVSRDYAKAHYVPAAQRQKLKAAAERVNADSALFAPVNHCGVAGSAFRTAV